VQRKLRRWAVRAQRRADQLAELGREVDLKAIEQEIIDRDRLDSSREVGPLVCPEDAVRVDTSALTLSQVVETLAELACEAIPANTKEAVGAFGGGGAMRES